MVLNLAQLCSVGRSIPALVERMEESSFRRRMKKMSGAPEVTFMVPDWCVESRCEATAGLPLEAFAARLHSMFLICDDAMTLSGASCQGQSDGLRGPYARGLLEAPYPHSEICVTMQMLRSWQEWLALCKQGPTAGKPQARVGLAIWLTRVVCLPTKAAVLHYAAQEWRMLPCWVLGYEA